MVSLDASGLGTSEATVTDSKWPAVEEDGWVRYVNTLTSRVGLVGGFKQSVAGERDGDGHCVFGGKQSVSPDNAHGVLVEDVAFNPTTCERVTITVDVTPEAATQLESFFGGTSRLPVDAVGPGERTPSASAVSGQGVYPCSGPQGSTKSAWIDPVQLTITALSANVGLNWDCAGTDAYSAAEYRFPYDGWSADPVVNSVQNFGWEPYQYSASQENRNTDFAMIVSVASGLAWPFAWAACGFPTSFQATFRHHDVVDVYKDTGNVTGAWSDSAAGACSTLVHHAAWVRNYKQSGPA